MNEFDIFDEQTDFSFLGLAEAKTPEVSKTQAKRTPLVINGNSISVKIYVEDIGKWNIGKKHSKEHRAKLTAVNKGRKLSGKALENVRAGHLKRNTKISEATKAKISKANKGRVGSCGNSKSVMTPAGEFRSITEAARFYGITRREIGYLMRNHEAECEGFYRMSDGGKKPIDTNKVTKKVGRKPKSIMTPAGVFESAKQAAEFFGFAPLEATRWTRMYPQQFYYIKD